MKNKILKEYYYDILLNLLKILIKYIPFLKNISLYDMRVGEKTKAWNNDAKNPYIDYYSSTMLMKDIEKRGTYFLLILIHDIDYNKYIVKEGCHRVFSFQKNNNYNYYFWSLVISNKWLYYYDEQKILEIKTKEFNFKYPIKIMPKYIKCYLKNIKKLNQEYYEIKTNNLFIVFSLYLCLSMYLSKELFYTNLKPINFNSFV